MIQKLNSGIKKLIWVCHRRGGKDITIFNWCIEKLLSEVCTCFYVLPTYSQAKKVIWDAINNDGFRIIDYIPKELIANKNGQEMKIRLINGSVFQLIGSDNIDTLMGTNPKIVVFSEYAIQNPAAWDYISPILKVNKGYSIFISTPRGKNHFYEMLKTAKSNPRDWYWQINTILDTGVLTQKDMDEEKADGKSEELIQQEYYCSFDRGVEGSYYDKLLIKMESEERICAIDYDPYKMVHTSWDLGWDDCTAIIFFQIIGSRIHIIDVEEHNTTTLANFKEILLKKKYKYGIHLFPFDVETNDGLGSGCTRKEILEDLDISVTVVPKHLIADGIESVKALLSSKIIINKNKCERLIRALGAYHREWDDKHKVYSNKPRHDWASHLADSLRYLAMGLSKVQNDGTVGDDYKALKNYWGG